MTHPLEEFIKGLPGNFYFSSLEETAYGWGDGVRSGNGDGDGRGLGGGAGNPTGAGDDEGVWTEQDFLFECFQRDLREPR